MPSFFEANAQFDIETARAKAPRGRAPALGDLRLESIDFVGRHGGIRAIGAPIRRGRDPCLPLWGAGARGLERGVTRLSGSLLSRAAIFSGSNSLLRRETVFLTGLRRGLALVLALAILRFGFGFDLALTIFFGLGFGLALAFFTGFGLGLGLALAIFFLGLGFGLAFTTFTGFLVAGFFFLTTFFLTGTAAFFFLAVFLPALILVN